MKLQGLHNKVVIASIALIVVFSGPHPGKAAAELDLAVGDTQMASTVLDLPRARNTQSIWTAAHVLQTLVRVDFKTGAFKPGLAESWKVSADGRVLTFTLKAGVMFQDGTPFNAQAVKFNFDRAREQKSYVWNEIGGDLIQAIDAKSATTLIISYSKVFADVPGAFAREETGISSPAAIQKFGDQYGTTALVGTGPFKFVNWVPSSEVVLERWDGYKWGSREMDGITGPSAVRRVSFRGIHEEQARWVALKSGQIQLARIGRQFAKEARETPNMRVALVGKVGTSRMFLFNVTKAPTNALAVRQAFAYAIDRKAILGSPGYAGIGNVSYMPMANANWPADPQALKGANYLYDPAKAQEILQADGWVANPQTGVREKAGQRLVLKTVIFPDGDSEVEIAPAQAMLQKVGIGLDIVQGDLNFWLSSLKKGEFDVSIWSTTSEGWAPMFNMFTSSGAYNYGYSNPKVDGLAKQLEITRTAAERKTQMADLMSQVLKDAYVIPIIDQAFPWAMSRNLDGLQWLPMGFAYVYPIHQVK
jgi:peptide/nickel transport system substrate-binding protein